MIVARHEVPGTASTENRPVGYGKIHSKISSLQASNRAHACANQTVPYGTALLDDAVPGTSCQARHEQAIARRMATIAPLLRDKSRSPIEGPRIKLAFVGFQPGEPHPRRRALEGAR
jgi:hypothetical protein